MSCSDHGWCRALLRTGVLSAAFAVIASAPVAGAAASTPLDDCIARKVEAGTARPVAQAECIKEIGPAPASTMRPDPAPTDDEDEEEDARPTTPVDDGGTSVGALLAVGVGGLVVGAALTAVLLRRRPAAAATAPAPFGSPSSGMPLQPLSAQPGTTMPASPFAGPPAAAAPSTPVDRGPALIVALVDLTDRVNSQALRADILAALARVGVLQIEIPPGEAFDASRMRGVGSAPTPDPSLVGRVATTDRPGFRDGTQVIRLPDVIVHVAGDPR